MKPVRIVINKVKRRSDMLLEEFDKVNDLDHTHIVYLKHKKTGLNIVKIGRAHV